VRIIFKKPLGTETNVTLKGN